MQRREKISLTATFLLCYFVVGLLMGQNLIEFADRCSSKEGGKFGELLLNEAIAHPCLHIGFGLKERENHHLACTAIEQIRKADEASLLSDRWDDGLFGDLNGFLHLCWLNLATCYSCVHGCVDFLNSSHAVRCARYDLMKRERGD